ncbi:MAG: sulfopyruvate decarboxylase subunit alpha [Nitrospirota bacterium]
MRGPEEELINIIKGSGIDFTSSLPCEKIKGLLNRIGKNFFHVPLTREEEGVGISAGAALAGKRPAMFVQSSGIGNMINALLSLTVFYELPLAIFVSQRGIYREKILAQLAMGQRLPDILRAAGISFSTISSRKDFKIIEKKLPGVYSNNLIHVFLLSPAVFKQTRQVRPVLSPRRILPDTGHDKRRTERLRPWLRRFDILKILTPHLDSKVVICNLGIPSKELFHLAHQPSNFYMLGSMGMATPVGLGVSLSNDKDVIVIDGDGSLLMNPGTLATVAHMSPRNLTILAIDNRSYGSTGGQPSLTSSCVDLEAVAQGFGIRNTEKAADRNQLLKVVKKYRHGPAFIHILATAGNEPVANITLNHINIKKQFQDFLKLH